MLIEHYGKISTVTIGRTELKQYKAQWVKNDGRHNHVSRTKIVYADSLDSAIQECIKLYGERPTKIQRI